MSDIEPLVRQWQLLRTLKSRQHGATIKELATEFRVSQKTIGRDLNLLRRLAFPIVEAVGEHGRKSWMMSDISGLPALSFTLEEAAALYLGQQFLEVFAGTLFWQGAHSAFAKIRAALGEPALRHLQKLATSVHLTQTGTVDYESRAQLIDELMIGIEDRKLTVITYQSLRSTEPVTLYDIHPYAMVHHRGSLYVIAWSKDHGGIRTFKADRISDVSLQGLQFERPKGFDPARYLENSFGIFGSDQPPETVRVRFTAKVVRILEEKHFHSSQQLTRQGDGSILAEYRLATFDEFASWLLSFGPEAEALEPAELRDRVAEAHRKAATLYETVPDERVRIARTKPR